MKLPKITMNDWAKAEAEFLAEKATEAVPKGWMTTRMYADSRDIALPTANRRLLDMFHAGIMERKLFHSTRGAPYIYRPKKK